MIFQSCPFGCLKTLVNWSGFFSSMFCLVLALVQIVCRCSWCKRWWRTTFVPTRWFQEPSHRFLRMVSTAAFSSIRMDERLSASSNFWSSRMRWLVQTLRHQHDATCCIAAVCAWSPGRTMCCSMAQRWWRNLCGLGVKMQTRASMTLLHDEPRRHWRKTWLTPFVVVNWREMLRSSQFGRAFPGFGTTKDALDPSFLASAALDVEMTSLEHVHLQCACKWTKFQCPKSVSFFTCSSTFCFTQSWSSTYFGQFLDIFGHVWTSLDILGKSKANCRGRSVHLSGIPPSKLDGLGLAGPLCDARLSNAFNPCRDW